MALLDWILPEDGLTLKGERVRLRTPRIGDYPEWAELRARSRDFLQPWEPLWPADDLTRGAFRRRVAAYNRETEDGAGWSFFILSPEDELAGGVRLINLRRGVAQSASVGYWAGLPFNRRGYVLDAVRTVTRFAFDTLRLHRLEAQCVPENAPSRALLLKAGFTEEGRAAAYLKINDQWRDHLMFGLVAPGGEDPTRSDTARADRIQAEAP